MASSARLTAPIYPSLDFDLHPTGHGSATPSPASSSMDELFRKISTAVADEPDGTDLFAKAEAGGGGITLEEYLSKDDIRVPAGFPVDPSAAAGENPAVEFGNGGGGGRGRKRPVMDLVDRAAVQRQKRMIKNRESAARSRERKQAYTVELESLVTQLEEENARLVKEQEELRRKRLKQLMESLVPVTENKRSPQSLRRTHSMQW
ncbi:uncharacterized protein M6B38_323765 [Iris pallida]|uniref:BZIP domain-containing protein n=1 Tax=Iris pallida TaxID=29817 RepID=A0AAX6GV30_IRIPA|nr:uncharacterized protein M6B38_343230 [Iris pallida]KAJ6837049.1 uncharacterized protein M6B38_323765 [Iris pallida]